MRCSCGRRSFLSGDRPGTSLCGPTSPCLPLQPDFMEVKSDPRHDLTVCYCMHWSIVVLKDVDACAGADEDGTHQFVVFFLRGVRGLVAR